MSNTSEKTFQTGEIVDPSQLAGREAPEREWFVEGLLPHKTVSLLSGDGGLGKSLLMQQLITCAATGNDWLGMPVKNAKTFGFFCEDSNEELWRRQQAICHSMSITLEDCYDMKWLSGDGVDPVLMEFTNGDMGRTTPLFDDLVKFLVEQEVGLVIIDTAADTFAGNEISRIQVRNFINRALKVITEKLDATVILTSHPSVAGMREKTGLSGSTAWNNSVRSRLYLTRPEGEANNDVRVLQMMKSNYGNSGHEIRLIWRDGAFVAIENTIGQNPNDRDERDDAAYLHGLSTLNERGQKALIHRNQANYAPKLMKGMQETKGISQNRLEAAQERLLNRNVIANKEDVSKPPSKRTSNIQIIDETAASGVMEMKIF